MIKVMIADDHSIVRRGLKYIIEEVSSIQVVDEAKDGKELIGKMLENSYDVILLDINMPGNNGLDILKDIKKINSKQIVLMLSVHAEEEYAIRSIKAGAAGYIRKDSDTDEIVKAIKSVYSGKKYLNSDLYDKIIDTLNEPLDHAAHNKLSNREFEVFLLIGKGKTLSEISEELLLSPKTISTYRARILEKMKIKNNAEIIRYVIGHHLD